MNYIIEFYKNLDIVNLFIFWGVIIVVLLLLIFSIIISNKNKKLQKIIESRGIDVDEFNDNAIPTLKNKNISFKSEKEINNDTIISTEKKYNNDEKYDQDFFKIDNTIETKKVHENEKINLIPDTFVAEEHVIDYESKTPEINKQNINDNRIIDNDYQSKEAIIEKKVYQKNILKEMSLNQTSPIGIVKKDINSSKELEKAEDLYDCFDEEKKSNANTINNMEKTNADSNHDIYNLSDTLKNESIFKKGNYLEELSKKSEKLKNEINRTEYELRQEDEAIISYEELMRKKDKIKMIDEEEAIISINELLKKKEHEEKIYNLNNEEDNNKFINELKDFRSDL